MNTFQDAALRKAFAAGLSPKLTKPQAVALQYALGRLGDLRSPVDGDFGAKSQSALSAFQKRSGLVANGVADAATLAALDGALAAHKVVIPALAASDPHGYLCERASEIIASMPAPTSRWSDPQTQEAFGRFVQGYWPVFKENFVEGDCKTVALFLMDRFREAAFARHNVTLPGPRGLARRKWQALTAKVDRGYFERAGRRKLRRGYGALALIEDLDPEHSVIYGVNVIAGNVTCADVGACVEIVAPYDKSRDGRNDTTVVEIPLEKLHPGALIFLDHEGDGRFDHAITVITVERDSAERPRKLVLAVGSFDDVQDADSSTKPGGGHNVNNYTEEVTVHLDERGRVSHAEATWTSEPRYLFEPRYGAHNTVMDTHARGRIVVARWR